MRHLSILTLALILGGCSSKKVVYQEPEVVVIKDKGTELYVWQEPIVDVINVPAGMDPEGIYYRPEHQQIVEIKQGRWVLKN
ncbi:MAG: hypothetical protein NZT61_04720 [Deltaproteobacteria bacterium]|nr:hypothetical protein [Deltaproteobacteria bacterium]MCX7953264.1 hypothetical protein [Deltaproteobacteria bacterium]